MAGASAEDLEEIAEGKASARDKREAGVHSVSRARNLLRMRRQKVHTSHVSMPVRGKRYRP